MNIQQFVSDVKDSERGVSPVIGVILMVAITVILAAVIGAFVLDLGSQLGSTAPQAQINADFTDAGASGYSDDSDKVTFVHKSGDTLNTDRIAVKVGNEETSLTAATASGVTEMTAGDELTFTEGDADGAGDGDSVFGPGSLTSGEDVKLVWSTEGGGSSQTLLSTQVP